MRPYRRAMRIAKGQRISRLVRLICVAGLLSAGLSAVTAAPAHASAQSHEAWVEENGTLLAGVGVVGVKHLNIGQYEVTFDSRVNGCSYTASIEDPGTSRFLRPGLVFVAGGHLSWEGVYVETKNPGGGLTDYRFHLQVKCVEQGLWAVVNDTGTVTRSGGYLPVAKMGTGLYQVYTPDKVCSLVATIGDYGNRLVYSPAMIETDPQPYGGFVHIRDLKGGRTDRPFHLQVQCPSAAHGDFVVVDKVGALVGGSPYGSARIGPGEYEVYATRAVKGCVLTATPTIVPDEPAHLVFPRVDLARPTVIYVQVTDLFGYVADAGFSLQVTFLC